MSFLNRNLLMLCCMLSSVLLVGCGGDGRLEVIGKVSVDGKPVEYGSISFKPINQTKGPTAGATIREGSYEVSADKGLFPGDYRVEIVAIRTVNKKSVDMVTGEVLSQRQERFLPPKYNDESELTVEIGAGNAPYDFELSLNKKK